MPKSIWRGAFVLLPQLSFAEGDQGMAVSQGYTHSLRANSTVDRTIPV